MGQFEMAAPQVGWARLKLELQHDHPLPLGEGKGEGRLTLTPSPSPKGEGKQALSSLVPVPNARGGNVKLAHYPRSGKGAATRMLS